MEELVRLYMGQVIERGDLETTLQKLRYRRRDFVSRPGEYADRGAQVDIYPVTYRAPIRLSFDLDTIQAIADFSPHEGKSLTRFEEVFLIPFSEPFEASQSRLRDRFETFEPLSEITDLEPGDFVVHLQYGVARYLGTKKIEIQGKAKRHIALEFADREILYLEMGEPLERYIGVEGEKPKLTRLHTKEWDRAKAKARLAVENVARDLVFLQAKRKFGSGFSFPKDSSWQDQFEDEFPFEETPDQLKATAEVKGDMESEKPMDRLLCGDVGYGKTEVAMRAAVKAAVSGKQVAFLVPTTILAEQHWLVFKERVKNFPIDVEVLSRFRSKKDQLSILKKLGEGKVDILIGTHRLLSSDVHFKDLGLVIIDEEQRFGVAHKEKLKKLREIVDVLTLTATPIPRTLYLSLMGARDMSIINTPPRTRLPIKTEVIEYDDQKIVEAVHRELARGGQVYFVHNRIESIEKVYAHSKSILPEVRFSIAHGQLPAHTLEKIMKEFLQKKIDCLITTNIIESGLDIPNVNTIIVNRADRFGLADLYQLRGRVGRFVGERQAYAYFIVPRNWVMTLDAEKRLEAIERFTELGSGFKIALKDLEIRGAGNILGHEQSGFIHAVGFDLYCRMLRRAIDEQKSKDVVTPYQKRS
ncbi:MAG: transcription-repair coupling factor [Candidatus Omnitrophica bacterium]|nr:transcription-repair coupling factor [Candidatus Omnitrophota bacterium]